MAVSGITPIAAGIQSNIAPISANSVSEATGGISFADMLETGIDKLNSSMITADQLVTKLAAGEDVDLHQVMIALETETIQLQTALQIRNKAVDSYREIMQMPL